MYSKNSDKDPLENVQPIGQIASLIDNKQVREAHHYLEKDFLGFFNSVGYETVPAIPLLSDVDGSVIFTGASISAVKDLLLDGTFPTDKNGIVLAQECIRTKAFKHAFNNNWIPFGQIYFTMVSILSKPERFQEVLSEALNYTIDHFGVPQERVLIRSTSKNPLLGDIKTRQNVQVKMDEKPDSYYHWEYGINGVFGEGLTISLQNESNDTWQDIGNIVIIYDSTGREIGIEFGYGNEFFLYSATEQSHSLKLSKVFECFPFQEGLALKYYSTLEAIAMMKLAGAKLGDKGPNHIYKQYLKSLEYIGISMDKQLDDILNELSTFLQYSLPNEKIIPSLDTEFAFLSDYQKRKIDFAVLVKRVGNYLWNKENGRPIKEKFSDPIATIIKYMKQNGISEFEILYILERLNRFDFIEQMRKHDLYTKPKSKF